MLPCFKGATSGLWERDVSNSQNAVYTSVSDFDQDRLPKISKIIESLRQFDGFKYSAYRTAFKLRTIQKASKLHMVELSVINSILKDYECNENSMNEVITLDKAENLICTLYTEAGKRTGISEEPNVMALLFLAFLQNTFAQDDKPLLFIHVKIALVLFSSAKLSEKFKYFFFYCANGNTISRENLHQLLFCLSKVAEVVGEKVTFGAHLVPASVKHLLKYSKGQVTLKKFQKWLLLEPQSLVWVSTLHRISASENNQHSVSCTLSSNLENKSMLSVQNKLPFARCPTKPYLSFDEESLYESLRDITRNASRNSLLHHTLKKTTAAYIVKELSSIVKKLEDDKKQISVVVENFSKENVSANLQSNCELKNTGKEVFNGECLQTFNFSLEKQLGRLKELLQGLQSSTIPPKDSPQFVSPVLHVPFNKAAHFFESTPLNSANFPTEAPKIQIPFTDSRLSDSENMTEQQRNHSTSLDFTTVLSSPTISDFPDSGNSSNSVSSLSKPSENYSASMSLGISRYLNVMSSLNLSEKMAKIAENNLSPVYMHSGSDFSRSITSQRSAECRYSATPMRSCKSVPSLDKASPMFSISKNESLEALELELQTMLQHIEDLLPQVSEISNSSLSEEKEAVATAISNMENAVKKLSHLSLALSIGSTDL
ncbi:hypothetical protein JTE90_004317 [Oedothorax gibbosus]|uniref:Dystrophin n=1 Tax=Oedothorax gibbosus TaxID=931172 RepID=A0AAV6VLZ4_9ARAC|nr:hypothetical protein JTE90_004317 [Oedothorax gibbosus]